MKIGQFAIAFPSTLEPIEVYGSERITYVLCNELSKKNHQIKIFVPYKKEFTEENGNIKIFFYKSIVKLQIYYISLKLLYLPSHEDLDIIHIHNDSPMAIIAGFFCSKQKDIPLVITWHGDYNGTTLLKTIIAFFLNKIVLKVILSSVNTIIAPSEKYVDCSNILPGYRKKIVEISHGLNFDDVLNTPSKDECRLKYNIDRNRLIVLYVSSLTEHKGADRLLEAIPEIVSKYPETQFIFVGGGNLKKYNEIAKLEKISDNVIFTGYVTEQEKYIYFKSADIFVFPSMNSHEVFPVVTLESAGFGLPIVVGKLKIFENRIIDGYNGLYFNSENPDSLSKVIIHLLENEELRLKLGTNARNVVFQKYTADKMAEETINVYNKLIKK